MNMRRYDLGKKQFLLFSIFLLRFSMQVQSQNCDVASTCSFFGYPKHNVIGLPDVSLTLDFSLTCFGDFYYDRVASIRWLSTSVLANPRQINVGEDPKLTTDNFDLEFRNVTGEYEAIYFCQAEYTNGEISLPVGVGCVFVAGRAFYKTCPETNTEMENCATATDMQAVVGGSVEFDTRVEFRHGGSCGLRQNVRLMFLDKVDENGDVIEMVFICSNLGNFGNIPSCGKYGNVSVSFQGDHKYDIKLRLDNLAEADAGKYRVRVDLDDIVGGRRISIYKNFTVTVQSNLAPSILDDNTTKDLECSKGSGPVLLLNGEVLGPNSTITFAQIKEGQQGLLCVTTNERCCNGSNNTTAQFLSPGKEPVTEVTSNGGLYVTKGRQIVRLNRQASDTEEGSNTDAIEGTYCCSIGDSDGSKETNCVDIEHL